MSQFVDKKDFDKNLRLGDIISGFSYIVPFFIDFFTNGNEFTLDIKSQILFAVLTPCCSIENKLITVVPLREIRYGYFENPYYREDMTRINRPMLPKNAFPPFAWSKLPDERKAELELMPESYVLNELFFYGYHQLLPTYNSSYKNNPVITCNIYMIDFKEAFTVKSDKIYRGNTYPKVLQLTIKSRGELRNKLAYFYSRIPEEDLV